MNDTDISPAEIDHELYPALVQCFVIIGLGYTAGQLNLLTNTHSTGLSRFIGNFALPAVIFKNLVNVQLQSLSWSFITAIFISKLLVFLLTAIVTGIGERPRNYGSMGLYAIMTTQTNDFALVLPIIEAVYKQSHPEYMRYVYILAPISLIILNPFGFFLIELQKRLNDRKKHPEQRWHRNQLIGKILLDVCRNPVVICTVLGVIFNQIFSQNLPNILNQILTPIAQSFSALALFYLGLTMVGKLKHLNTRLVVTVFLLSTVKLIIFPLISRQVVFFLLEWMHVPRNDTIDYSNFGFLYGTAPTAPSIIFYVPESDAALQSIASTGLVVSTLLAGPIMLISAKMINMKALQPNTTHEFESTLVFLGYDISIISLFCTIVVLIGFCVRRHFLRISFIHKYTFIFVGVQMIHALWVVSVQFVKRPITRTAETVLDIGGIFLAVCTRTWGTSISIALMIAICYSQKQAIKFYWLYHLCGWLVPIGITLAIYQTSSVDRSKETPVLALDKFGMMQIGASVGLLALCIIITSTNLLLIARRMYRLKNAAQRNARQRRLSDEDAPLIINEDDDERNDVLLTSAYADIRSLKTGTQLLRHAILVALLDINAFICICIIAWTIIAKSRDGVYYELQFLDTALLHGQGIITFLVFALDAHLLLPVTRRVMKLLHRCGLKKCSRRAAAKSSSPSTESSVDFEHSIRPDFIRHSISTQSMNHSLDLIETTFSEKEFCQWLVSNGYTENESTARNYCHDLADQKLIVCVNRVQIDERIEPDASWFAFAK